jgi:hypothetical protein
MTDNTEVKYRQGFSDGAKALLRKIEKFLPAPVSNDAYTWLEKEVENWLVSAKNIADRQYSAVVATPRVSNAKVKLGHYPVLE